MLNTLVVIVIVIAGAVLAYKSYRRRITGIADQNAVGHEEKAVDTTNDKTGGSAPGEGDSARFVFMKLYPAGKCAVSTSGDDRYRVHVQDALREASRIQVEVDRDKFRHRMQTLAVPQDAIEEFVANIRVLDETSLQHENP